MDNGNYGKLVNAYKTNVREAFASHRIGLMHVHPNIVCMTAHRVLEAIEGEPLKRLREGGFDNGAFYGAVNAVGHHLGLTSQSGDCGGLSPDYLGTLERILGSLRPETNQDDAEKAKRELSKFKFY